ncbi:DAHL domain-containing protein [Marinicella meishanensis]|uniref:DAHL domain-containing protein n=1 Tax=Marinicella meishanensis TaxID=2873263 RepID=UPI001CBD079A|nr:DAHL domain-containing protein [Marinicella sp. NBU2979]
MKPSILLLIYLSLAIGGAAGIVYYQSTLPDTEQMNNDVSQKLLSIDGLNASVGELALRSRHHIDNNYDNLTRTTALLEQSLVSLEQRYFNPEQLKDPMLLRNFELLNKEIMIQNDLIESFKSHNSVLRNSVRYAPAAGQNLMQIAREAKLIEAEGLYAQVVRELLEYALLGSSLSEEKLKIALPKLAEIETALPEFAQIAHLEFTRHVKTVLDEKALTDQYLSKALLTTSSSKIQGLSQAWNQWIMQQSSQAARLDQWVMAYIAFLLVGLGFIAWKLRSLYLHLDHEVAVQTAEVQKAFDDLKESESKLVQSEKMASLGQMVAGVAHEINTPLGYISSNVDTIRLNMGELDGILQSVDMISQEISQSKPNTKKIGNIVKRMVHVYRSMRQRETLSEIEDLLQDSSYGLSEISDLVSSLKDFSRLDRTSVLDTDLHQGLDATLKICSSLIGQRQVIKTYGQNIPLIECMPAQLNQVFMNIITNSAQATADDGVIEIITRATDQGVEIEFSDNGSGMSESTIKQIFDPFFTTKEVGEGTGLGMSISYKIIKSHGGDIEVNSLLNQGTQVTVKLPLKQSQASLSVIK